ncbi:Nramp family divalent metal transporter [Bdellovibrio svalbardensis]|uniref:Divalent metal cation transporter MntH n=1 Tax=Bdellovibrio svalbardensis TaxID=2972972 RepID=A0ABT6DFX8_9BACT|nr:Nramp family divalent metal transporter [Bdellovibrio svalbardensis]MDG0815755.1 Nramp family divalent metal transporter [Bdellovibrio svalbardensis]
MSDFKGSISIPKDGTPWAKFFRFLGPGLLVSVGYMDPGNWATDIEAGSRFGYLLLSIVLFSSLGAIALQYLSLKLGIASGMDLALASRMQFGKKTNLFQWFLAEIAIIATDIAEVLGSALAFKLLFGCSLLTGVAITCLDTFIVLAFAGKGFRKIEAIILGLVATIGICYLVELLLLDLHMPSVLAGYIPSLSLAHDPHSWYLAIGIVGATIMPHNLYLHSAIVQTRKIGVSEVEKRQAIRFSTIDTVVSLSLAFLVNSAILILAASAFHGTGRNEVADIQDAHRLLEPIMGSWLAPLLFAIALLASGQSSTFTGTIAGQVILEGYLNLQLPSWKIRLITRSLALIPAFIGVAWLGDDSTGKLLVITQVILGLQLPFAVYPLVKFTSDKKLMGSFANRRPLKLLTWGLFAVISTANIWLIVQIFN